MNELYQKINNYVYEIRMIELDGYIYGMNRTKIDKEKAYDTISDAPDSESNAITNFWKGCFADPELSFYKCNRVEKNQSRANAFYRKTVELDIEGMAEAGDQYAQTYFGEMFEYGYGVDQNYRIAVKWYRKAAEQGYAIAQHYLGYMYQNGWGVDKNKSTALEWFRKAAEQGHAAAQNNLGVMYQYGQGLNQNKSIAVEWYRKAAEQGHAAAQCNLGVMYQFGCVVDQNDSTAVEWYRKAAEQDHADAQSNIDRLTNKSFKENSSLCPNHVFR